MACEFLTGDGVLFSVWGKPTMADMDKAMDLLRLTYANVGGLVVYVSRIPVDAPAPDAEVRQYLNGKMPTVVTMCSTYHVVLEGVGFVAAMKRGVLVSQFQFGQRRNMFFVHSGVADVLQKVPPERKPAVRSLLNRAETIGLLSCRPPASEMTGKDDPRLLSRSSRISGAKRTSSG
jgi:hypothetical protein